MKSLLQSPKRMTRGRSYHATFASYNPRSEKKNAPCPVHVYASIEQELAAMPNHSSVGGVKFGDTPRESRVRSSCPVHVYADAKSSLSHMGSVKFGDTPRESRVQAECPVHAYADPVTSLRQRQATFAKFFERKESLSSGPDVHSYIDPTSTLNSKGASAFGHDHRSRDAFQQTARSLAPVHAYAAPSSTLRTIGGSTFGTPRSTPRSNLPSLTRTGLICATPSSPSSTPRSSRGIRPALTLRKSLPKLMPHDEGEASGKGDDNWSPREIEALLEVPQSP